MTKKEAIATLKIVAPRGSTILSIVRERDNDGMGRTISFLSIPTNGTPLITNITGYASIVTDLERYDTPLGEGLYIRGAGSNFARDTVTYLAQQVWDNENAYQHYNA